MYLVIGAGGFLGSYLIRELQKKNEKIIGTVRDKSVMKKTENVEWVELDVTDKDGITALKKHLEGEGVCVFYLAASHNIDFVFENPDEAYKVNVTALEDFLLSGIDVRKLFFASTDCVYGENTNEIKSFRETDEGKPVNVYGHQKAMAEKIVLSHGFTVARLPFMAGPSLSAYKKHFYDNICEDLRNGKTVGMIDGLYRSVLSYEQTAKLLVRLSRLDKELNMAINVCADKGLTKYETGCIIAEKNGLDKTLIKSLTENEGKGFFKDKRASSTVMDNTLLKKLLGEENTEFRFG